MATLDVSVISDVCDRVGAWQRAFLAEASLDRYRRACAWSMSEVAKAAAAGGTDATDTAFENPTPWMRRAFGYTRALTQAGDLVEASTFVKPSQSIVLKYGMGDGPQLRRPGDVGPARERILVPQWRNLTLTQGINRNSYGNVPGGVAACLAREALGQRAKRRVAGRWGVYKGEVDVGGSRIMGYIARPRGPGRTLDGLMMPGPWRRRGRAPRRVRPKTRGWLCRQARAATGRARVPSGRPRLVATGPPHIPRHRARPAAGPPSSQPGS